jgi:predicted  nucleic acid-binding Zn-ribbon protein
MATPEELSIELAALKQQIAAMQQRVSMLEEQVSKIEPSMEARASRTEKLVMDVQIELHKFLKNFTGHQAQESTHQANVEAMLKILLERTEAEPM